MNRTTKNQARSWLIFILLEDLSGVPNQTSISHDNRYSADPIDSDHHDNRAILPLRAPKYFQCEKTPIIFAIIEGRKDDIDFLLDYDLVLVRKACLRAPINYALIPLL